MLAIMCVLHTWLAELPASQNCLAVSMLERKNPTNQMAGHIIVACEYQISGKCLPNIVIPVSSVSSVSSVSMVWKGNWAVQAMLVKLAETDCHHPAAMLVNLFTARVGHAGPTLDEINDHQLVSRLKAKPLLVIGPFELPAKLAAEADAGADIWLTKLDLTRALGSLETVCPEAMSPQFQWLCDGYYAFRHAAAELMINMCMTRYSQSKTNAGLCRFCIAVKDQTLDVPELSMQQLVWLTKQSMAPGHLYDCASDYSLKSFIVNVLRDKSALCCEQAWRHGFVQAALDGVADDLPESWHWIYEFNRWTRQTSHDHQTRFGLVLAAFRVAKDHNQLRELATMLNLMCTHPDLSQLASFRLCQSAVGAGMLGAVQRAYARGAANACLVKLCVWLATHHKQCLAANLVDTILQYCPLGAEHDLWNLVVILAPSMDSARKSKALRVISNIDMDNCWLCTPRSRAIVFCQSVLLDEIHERLAGMPDQPNQPNQPCQPDQPDQSPTKRICLAKPD